MKVSVCMATYNGSRFIKKQVDSILCQLTNADELIVVDDCSLDNTIDILSAYHDSRIKIFANNVNMGVVYSFNKALGLAKGDLVFLSDQDDQWNSDKIQVLKDVFLTNDIDLIVHDAIIVSDHGIVHSSLFRYANSSSGFFKNIISNTYTGCCMAFKRSVLNKILPIPQKEGIYHDSWIGILADFYRYKTMFLRTPLIKWYRHENNTSSISRRNIRQIIVDRYNLIQAIILHSYSKLF